MQVCKTVAITGSSGMIGSRLVDEILSNSNWEVIGIDRKDSTIKKDHFKSYNIDLNDSNALAQILKENKVDRIIHLAALAHTSGEKDLSMKRYFHVNVDCAVNVFKAATSNKIPILFISTVDVLGFVKDTIDAQTSPKPVSKYGKTKAIAEERLKSISKDFDIFRFSPVYTKDVKKDIQKRYYLKEPSIAYRIGNGGQFEVLDINKAIREMKQWLRKAPSQKTRIIKDEYLLDVNDLIRQEQARGRAKIVLNFPRWAVVIGYYALRIFTGKSNKSYLVFKALWPFRSKEC